MAKQFLTERHIQFETTTLNPDDDAYATTRDELVTKSRVNHRTFPFVFVGTTFLGGYSDLVLAADTGKLKELGVVNINNDF
jgi:glutaredoxin